MEGDGVIWENCLRELKAVRNAQIVTYGAYERRFLRHMKERYVSATDEMQFVEHLIETAVNLVGCIYGQIYFPTFSNSLKEIGRYLAFEWTWPMVSGTATPFLQRAWELGGDDGLKRELIRYNMDDCRAAVVVANAIMRIFGDGAAGLNAVNVDSLEVDFRRTYGRLDCALPEFEKINNAAYCIRGQKCTREPTRLFGGASGSRSARAKGQRLIRRSRLEKPLKHAPGASQQGSDHGAAGHKSFTT